MKFERKTIKTKSFNWDGGNWFKAQKHGISITAIEEFFSQQLLVAADEKHSQDEKRFIAVGLSNENRFMIASFTMRFVNELEYIRVISTRYMHRKEIQTYEKEEI